MYTQEPAGTPSILLPTCWGMLINKDKQYRLPGFQVVVFLKEWQTTEYEIQMLDKS